MTEFQGEIITMTASEVRAMVRREKEAAMWAERERVARAVREAPQWPNELADDEWADPFLKLSDVLVALGVWDSGPPVDLPG